MDGVAGLVVGHPDPVLGLLGDRSADVLGWVQAGASVPSPSGMENVSQEGHFLEN